ncbi:hypothetical protein BHE90_009152 [Fusarium euwallaceae]|uniref:Uncharacterized protein n=2 Tax=Fusarium solani species complex TaxID=232080 RepID=A0A3M2S516_9HYPO|nr:hypothetical protein CDV36_007665 [Fusarium kuroshium]RTE76393.1 hypothetical protein BHE90_009152 [Fusarium euwallaceae]
MLPAPITSWMAGISTGTVIKAGALTKGMGAVTTAASMKSAMTNLATTRGRVNRWRENWAKTAQQESQLPEPPPPLLLPPPSRQRRQRPPPSPSSALLWEDPHPIPNSMGKDSRYMGKGYAWVFLLLLFAASLSDYRRRKQQSLTNLAPSFQTLKLENDEQ